MDKKNVKIFDSELKVMGVLWKEGDTPAKQIADILTKETGWNKNTTYTLIKRCIKKGAIERSEPGFMCHALISREEVQEAETDELINKFFDGSADGLFAALLGRKKLSAGQIEKLKQIVADLTPAGFMSACLIVFVTVGLFATSAASSTGRGHNDMPAARDPQTNGRDPAADGENTMSITHESADILCYEDGSPLKLYWNFPDGSAESSFEQIVRTKENILPDRTESKKEDLDAVFQKVCRPMMLLVKAGVKK